MQDNSTKKSTIKKNILYYIDYKGITRYAFYKKTGITRGILDQNNGMSEENTAKILAYFSDLSAEWLLTGRGNMLKSDENMSNSPVERNRKSCPQPSLLPVSSIDTDSLMQVVREQSATIREQSATIREITKLVGEAQEEAKKIVVPKGVRAISVTAG